MKFQYLLLELGWRGALDQRRWWPSVWGVELEWGQSGDLGCGPRGQKRKLVQRKRMLLPFGHHLL